MITLKEKIDSEIEWVISETTKIKLVPHRYNINDIERDIYYKSMIPMIYAYMEGFVKKSFKIYIDSINDKKIPMNNLSYKLITHQLEMKYNLFSERFENSGSKEKITEKIFVYLNEKNNKLEFNEAKLQNVNCTRLNKLLSELNFEIIEDEKIKDSLNKLLRYRNGIAHGENSYQVTEILVVEFIDVIIKTMDKISDIIVKGYTEKNYLI